MCFKKLSVFFIMSIVGDLDGLIVEFFLEFLRGLMDVVRNVYIKFYVVCDGYFVIGYINVIEVFCVFICLGCYLIDVLYDGSCEVFDVFIVVGRVF